MKKIIGSLCALLMLGSPLWANQVEKEYALVKQAYELREKNAQNDLKQYLTDYPYTTYYSSVQMMIGVLQVEKLRYKNAVKTFDKVEWKELGRDEQPVFFFYRGLAYLKQNMFKEGISCFKPVKEGDSPYALQGKFYYAYCWYLMGEYDKAINDLIALENTQEYKEIAPYIVTQIYYAQRHVDLAEPRAHQLLEQYPNNKNNGELERILGEIAYNEGRWDEAIDRLSRYEQSWREQEREVNQEDVYFLGVARLKKGQYAEAIVDLKRIKQASDTLKEKVYLDLGHAYVQVNDIEKAKLSYQAAMRYNITPEVKEEAMYNYALCTYQTGTALGESIQSFNAFLKAYPNSAHAEQVYELLAAMYMTSKNYTAALEAVCAIKHPNKKLQETKQYLRYQLGADALLQGKMQEVVSWMSEVIQNESKSSNYKTEAYYYRAEARYRMKQWEAAMTDLETYRQQPDYKQSPNCTMADYLQGYVSFNLQKYTAAQGCFENFISDKENQKKKALYADALNRIGDCQFNARKLNDAKQTYQQVINLGQQGADYALFQKGYVMGLLHQYGDKVNDMEQLVARYPKSDYVDDALYEAARAYLQQERSLEAINAYTRLVDTYPNSSYAKTASLERGMIYRNIGMYDQAIQAFETTIATYPATAEAYTALDGIEQVYVEQNKVKDYVTYIQTLGKYNMSASSAEDSLVYAAGEMQYMLGNYKAAAEGMSNYLMQYCPGGRHCLMATYNAADCYYRLGDKSQALEHYLRLDQLENNPYQKETFTRIAEIAYDEGEFALAKTYFERLLKMGLKGEELMAAKLGVMRTAKATNDYATIVAIATDIISDGDAQPDYNLEARYNRAKAQLALNNPSQAIADMKTVAQDVRLAEGAECKYLLAQTYFDQAKLSEAEQEIMSFASMKTQHQYWLAKSLILLSDINVERGELFQAKQYLLSLQQNYHAEDDIQQLVENKLQNIQQLEQPQIAEEEDKE